ncbi:MAG: hypothetical protein P8L85_22460 [Rubripirellula sp.]|nr:hypothetical protein [Rubripirellula sp.]
MNRIKSFTLTCLVLALVATCGCGSLTTDYGQSRGQAGRTSLNGFGALRKSYSQAGFRDRDISRLTDRVMDTDVIVWTPQMLLPVGANATNWFNRWLSRGGRTLVYVIPDSGSEVEYWSDASKLAAPPQRLEYRRRAARSTNERMLWRMNRPSMTSNGWFRVESLIRRQPVREVTGPWQDDFDQLSAEDYTPVGIEFDVLAVDPEADNSISFAKAINGTGPTGPGNAQWLPTVEPTSTVTPTQSTPQLSEANGKPLVVQIQSKRWRDSQILVVAGGSLLTNYSFTNPFNRVLADRIIQASQPANVASPLAGFLTSNRFEVPVSVQNPGVPEASGMELLTVWPLSLVTMHGLMLGVVICLMLLPIFGRPRRIRRTNENEFGHHLDAVAALMNKAGGERYARMRISEYFKRMHGEASGPWVLPEDSSKPPEMPPPSNLQTLTPKKLSTRRPGADPAARSDETPGSPPSNPSTPPDEAER